ncbi:MAG: DNA polymerase III subunit delta [Dehalococcoidales bacterium]|nr:DNA polymerase III subunit delta [Dehalococcoidales bacterium]
MLHIFVGEDDFSIRQALEGIKKGIGDATALMTNTTVLDGREVTVEQLRNACDTVPFLSEKRLVIVERLPERFGPGERTGGKKKAGRTDGTNGEHQKFADALKDLPPFTEAVIIGAEVKTKDMGKNPLLKALAPLTKIQSFPLMKDIQLRQWIERRVRLAGGSITPAATALLSRFVGNDLWTMSSEVDKLLMYAGSSPIEEKDVRDVVSYAQEANVFAMIDAILEMRTGYAQRLMQQLLKGGVVPAQLLVLLSRQVRIIFQVKEMRLNRVNRADMQKKLGLTSDFLLTKAWEQADRYSPKRLRELYQCLLETDIAIKTGKLEGDLAMNILVVELGQKDVISTR